MYDIIIIGGGPAGYRAAEIAGKYGKKTLLIEEHSLGGVCLNEGCIPLKSYLHACCIREKAVALSKNHLLQNENIPIIDIEELRQKTDKTISSLKQGIANSLRAAKIEILHGKAKISSVTNNYITVDVNNATIKGRHLIIATGSSSAHLPDENVAKSYKIINSTQIFNLENIPKNIYIIGAGAIGLEAACFFNMMGADVTVIEALPHIAGNTDKEIADALQKTLERIGIKFFLNTVLHKFSAHNLTFMSAGNKFNAETECVLIAIGRKPLLDDIGLENSGVKYDVKGIQINEKCCTTNSLIYACGDVTGKKMLAHMAYHQARIAVDNICNIKKSISYDAIPTIIYTFPQIISIGLNEDECIKNKISYRKVVLPMTYNGKYFSENGKDGTKAKLLIDSFKHILLGFHAVGHNISEIALSMSIMIKNHMTVNDINDLVFPHPTLGEIIFSLANGI